MPTYEEVLSLAKRLPGDDRARLLIALSAMAATSPTNALHAIEVEGTDELIAAEEIAESEAALQDYRIGQDPGMTATTLKQRLLEDEADPKQVIDFVEVLETHHTTDALEAQPFSLQDIAALPLAQRYTLLSPYMAATAEDFAQDPALTEFADLDREDWGDDDEDA